jgi:hypothetical protein
MKGSEGKPYARFKSFKNGEIETMQQISEEHNLLEYNQKQER